MANLDLNADFITIEEYFKPIINWKFISFIEDCIQEYVDVGYKFIIEVVLCDEYGNKDSYVDIYDNIIGFNSKYRTEKRNLDIAFVCRKLCCVLKLEGFRNVEILESITKRMKNSNKFKIDMNFNTRYIIKDDVRYCENTFRI